MLAWDDTMKKITREENEIPLTFWQFVLWLAVYGSILFVLGWLIAQGIGWETE